MIDYIEICQALSVEARVRILQMLKSHPLCVNGLTCRMNMTQSAVSQHLRILKSAGLVKAEKNGYWVHYSVNNDTLAKARKLLDEILSPGREHYKKAKCIYTDARKASAMLRNKSSKK